MRPRETLEWGADEHVSEQLERRRERLCLRRPLNPVGEQGDREDEPTEKEIAVVRNPMPACDSLKRITDAVATRASATKERQPTKAIGRLSGAVAQRTGIPTRSRQRRS